MSYQPLRLCDLALLGPDKDAAHIALEPGLNVIRGASDTGKSFIVAAIDYMLGGRDPLKKITESEGYNRLLLSFHAASTDAYYTLIRGTQGGDFELYAGRHIQRPDSDPQQILKLSPQATPSISSFLLSLVGLTDMRVMKNKDGETERLGFRNLTPLCVINETKIQSETPPALSEQVVQQTKSKQVLKLVLTGVDDSGVVSKTAQKARRAKSAAQIELVEELIAELQLEATADGRTKDGLSEQLARLDGTIASVRDVIGQTELAFAGLRQQRFDFRRQYEANDSRFGEIHSLRQRLDLLNDHYGRDLERLDALSEAGQVYRLTEAGDCLFCGADPDHQRLHVKADIEVERTSAAAEAEIAKILQLRSELHETINDLEAEAAQIQGVLPLLQRNLDAIDARLREQQPHLTEERQRFAELLETRSEAIVALDRFTRVGKLVDRRDGLDEPGYDQLPEGNNEIDPGLSEQALFGFARSIEEVLRGWNYPEPRSVALREKDLELIVGGKPRSSSGKGVRALLHSAFSLGLLFHSRSGSRSHPGFVVLDSPLLTYAPPEEGEVQTEDDVRMANTGLRDDFFESLRELPNDVQVIIIENVPVPQWVLERTSTTVFTRANSGRYGYIPVRQ